MLPEKSRETQLVARVAQKIIQGNMDVPEIRRIKWTVRVVVSFHLFITSQSFFSFLFFHHKRIRIWKMVSYFFSEWKSWSIKFLSSSFCSTGMQKKQIVKKITSLYSFTSVWGYLRYERNPWNNVSLYSIFWITSFVQLIS